MEFLPRKRPQELSRMELCSAWLQLAGVRSVCAQAPLPCWSCHNGFSPKELM